MMTKNLNKIQRAFHNPKSINIKSSVKENYISVKKLLYQKKAQNR